MSDTMCQIPGESAKIVSIAHRGGIIPEIPENTLLAFKKSIEIGVDVIEIDLRSTKDGDIIIMHDETIDRTTNGTGKVNDMSLTQLKKLDLGYGQQIPSFKELLELVRDTDIQLLLDIKENDQLDRRSIIRLIENYGMTKKVILGVRSLPMLDEFHQINADIRTLGFISKIDQADMYIEHGVNFIRFWPDWIYSRPDLINSIVQKGIPVWATAGNLGEKDLQLLIDLGISGIIQDNPEFLVAFLSKSTDSR